MSEKRQRLCPFWEIIYDRRFCHIIYYRILKKTKTKNLENSFLFLSLSLDNVSTTHSPEFPKVYVFKFSLNAFSLSHNGELLLMKCIN